MAHNHQHDNNLIITANLSTAFRISIVLNLLYVCAEIVSGLIYNSMALLTDAGHNVSDVASLLLSLLAFRLAKKRPTSKFTYGYKKLLVLAALWQCCYFTGGYWRFRL